MNYHTTLDWKPPQPDKAVHLYKIHGSLNWLYCPVCKQILITPKEKGVSLLIDRKRNYKSACPNCKGSFVPILIPPTFFKVMSNSQLVRVWDLAEHALTECDNIIFCGYSLPDADIHIKYLLKRGCLNRTKKPPRIIIVNNYRINKKEKPDHIKAEEKSRYQRLFSANVDYTNYSFEEFSSNLHGLV